ncbi:glycerate kinase [Tessaracoccus sp. ZS01]|uniref:glycerate kinase n=1 Tax=Tessaracoccus sp. ZS01 TaxID=1906324 RepID=UPI00096F7F71|nr:glycerate kinase [Tessaracoccus sp. ZS01]MCG6568163.1 glycerate kinase [Tessaracoccus sp. ZS01]OMG54085.1 hypothetical protein BJN44_11120 [Tessaracoccus sp. ZS01]
MRVVIAPDSFKSTMTAVQAARAIADGWVDVRPADRLTIRPMADGGEGTLDAFATLASAERLPLDTVDALGDLRHASWVRLPDGTGVVELAHCCGLTTIGHLAPREAHTRGLGLAIRAALDAGATRLLLALGGSASTDGGLGLLVALGLSVARAPQPTALTEQLGNAALPGITAVEWAGVVPPPEGGALVLSDVTNPLLGPDGAAAVFGPQKGGASLVEEMDANLAHWAALVGGDPHAPGAGAAGGAGFALQLWGATTTSGARVVADAIGLREAMEDADLVVTGEGSFDAQSFSGKAVDVVRQIAAEVAEARGRDLPVALVAGRREVDFHGLAVALWDLAGERALADPIAVAREAGRQLAMSFR